MGKLPESERCYKAYLKRSPDSMVYRTLANSFKIQGKLEQWRATLDDYLKVGQHDLDYVRIQTDIADYLMDAKKWEEARPYAEEAAETGSEWGMLCANRCCEGLGEWEKAESFICAVSERYRPSSIYWFDWCGARGQGRHRRGAAALRETDSRNRRAGDRV